jgi:16S rRNA processing protein RimM
MSSTGATPPSPPPEPPTSRGRTDKRITLAAVAGAHGIKGEVRLKLFSDSIDRLSGQKRLYLGGVARRLLAIREG